VREVCATKIDQRGQLEGEMMPEVICLLIGLFVTLAILGKLFKPANRACGFCGNDLHKKYHVWIIEGKKVKVCNYCNQKIERKKSSAAWGKKRPKQRNIEDDFDNIY
jgi:hypothetical protein